MKRKIMLGFTALVAIILIAFAGKIGEDVDNKNIVINQVPFTGTMQYWTDAGFKFQWFGNITIYEKTQQVWFSDDEEEGSPSKDAIPITFNDAGNGRISGSVRIKLPINPKQLSLIHTDFAGMNRLMTDLIRPTVNKVVYASGTLMSSFESYAEKKNDLTFYITDQLNNGVYKTITKEVKTIDAISGEEKIVKLAELIPNPNSPGGFERQESSPFNYYGIEMSQVAISKVNYDKKIIDQISQQQTSNMSIQTAKVEAMAAKQRAIKAEEDGKAEAMKAKWEQERIKVVAVTKAQQELEVAQKNTLRAAEEKKTLVLKGQGEAEANRLKVSAGLTPQEKAEWDYKTKVAVAEAFANSKTKWVPEIMIVGEGKQSGSDPMSAVGLKMLMDVSEKMNTSK